ncbi:SDR family oxidoreductase [Sphingopyxis sp.]|uniref:SDR family oxidoreductase n=1 Tax=Sphingopyxis sp. TaxID=1908224 RepID=UPI0010F6FE76|nr:SDR family oxidoreductase [Sphingopyxis sp.]MBR2174193.1 SDR family oxidoreductase [Sphingopyxis sp.]
MAKQPKAGKVGESAKEKKGKRSAATKLRRAVGSGKTIAKPPPDREADLDRAPKWQPRYPGSGRLDGKVAIVTGGDSGIGRAVCALFAREGADIAIVYLDNKADADDTAAIVAAEGRRAITIKADVGKAKAGEKIVAQTVGKLGRLDILVNNAGEQHPAADIRDISEDQLQRTFATNIFGMFYLVQAALPHLKKGAAIVNCTSVTMYQGSKGLLDYSATKGAITAFTRSLSENLVDKGIRVNGVAPGPIWTPLNPRGGAPAEKVATFGESTPMKRPGEPNEVAPCFLFLACDDSSYMSGQVLHPNGGTIVNG